MFLQRLEKMSFVRCRVFLPQLLHHGFENHERPALLKKFFGRQIMEGFVEITVFVSSSNEIMEHCPPRLIACFRSQSFARKFFNGASRKERNFPFSCSTSPSTFFSSRWPKNPWVKSSASSGE